MWSLLSRLIYFTYDMIFRLTRNVFLWTSKLKRIDSKPAVPSRPPTPSEESATLIIADKDQNKSNDNYTVIEMEERPIEIPLQTALQSESNISAAINKNHTNPNPIILDTKIQSESINPTAVPPSITSTILESKLPSSTSSISIASSSSESVKSSLISSAPSIPTPSTKPTPYLWSSEEIELDYAPENIVRSSNTYFGEKNEIPEVKKTKINIETVKEEGSKTNVNKDKLKNKMKSSKKGDRKDVIRVETQISQSQNSEASTDKAELNSNKTKAKKSKRKKKEKLNDEFIQDARPNYFVAFQVSSKDIKSKVLELQESMLIKEVTTPSVLKVSSNGSIFKETMIPVDKLHFTLHVFHLDHNQIEPAKVVLSKCFDQCSEEFKKNPMQVNIEGLGHFRNSVIFAKIKGDEEISRLDDLCSVLRTEYEAINIISDSKVFKPHMTIAKMSRSKKLHKKKIRSFPPEIWLENEFQHFGYQKVESLQLLSMTETDPKTGYYRSVAEFYFNEPLDSSTTAIDQNTD